MEDHLNKKTKELLDELLEISEEYLAEEKQSLKIKRYRVTKLKKSKQSTRPRRIKEDVDDLKLLKSLFDKVEKVIHRLDMKPEMIRYYADAVIKSEVFQISRQDILRLFLKVHQEVLLSSYLDGLPLATIDFFHMFLRHL